MAINQITINFEDCEPIGGYYIFYRPIGSVDPYRFAGIFFANPIVFTDENDPINQEYEGYMQSHCGGGVFGDIIPWESSGSVSGSGSGEGSTPGEDECCDPIVLTADTETTIPDGSGSEGSGSESGGGSGSDEETCCTPVIISACIETIPDDSGSESEGSESDSGSEPPPDTFGIMVLLSALGYASMSLEDLTFWNTFYNTGLNADAPFNEIILYPDDLKIVLKGPTSLILENPWESNPDLKGFWDNAGIVIEADGSFLDCANLEVVEMLYTPIIGGGVYSYCPNLISVDIPMATSVGAVCFQNSTAITNIDLPSAITVGNNCFDGCTALTDLSIPVCSDLGSTTGDENVFAGITGNTFTLTILTATATDGDVVELQANNTVTLILV